MNLCMTFERRLADARNARGLSQADLADEIGAGQSTVATWERGKNEPDLKTIEKLAKVLDKPPEWLAFAVNESLTEPLAFIPEMNVRAPSGGPGMLEVHLQGGESGSQEMTVRKFGFPRDEFRQLLGVAPNGVVVVEVIGDSMMPTLVPGERVFVDTNDRRASPPGIFVVWDGLGLVLKRVEYVAQSDPPRVRILSDNPRYDSYERELGEAAIQGRVIGSLHRR